MNTKSHTYDFYLVRCFTKRKILFFSESIKRLSEKFISMWVPKFIIPRRKSLLPSFEAWAMVSIIFVMKLLLGLNDSTEIFLSELALEINRWVEKNYFLKYNFDFFHKIKSCISLTKG